MLSGVEDIAICNLTGADVVRHVLVQRIIKAYEGYEKKREAVQAHRDARGRKK